MPLSPRPSISSSPLEKKSSIPLQSLPTNLPTKQRQNKQKRKTKSRKTKAKINSKTKSNSKSNSKSNINSKRDSIDNIYSYVIPEKRIVVIYDNGIAYFYKVSKEFI